MLFFDTEDFNRLSPEGKKQYFKYMDHYEDKWVDWDCNVDMTGLIESDAKEHKEYKEEP